MFKKIVLDNFKSFNHITLDLSGPDKSPLPYALIYGENGSGKSNLIESLMFLKDTMKTFRSMGRTSGELNEQDILLKASWNAASEIRAMNLSGRSVFNTAGFKKMFKDLCNIVTAAADVRMIGSDAGVSVSYHFVLKGHDGHYEMRFGTNNRLIYEKLSYVVESRTKDIFEIAAGDDRNAAGDTCINTDFSPRLFRNSDHKRRMEDTIQRCWGRHSFLSMLDHEYAVNNSRYMDGSMGTGIADVIGFFNDFVIGNNYEGIFGRGIKDPIMANLESGRIRPDEERRLRIYEDAVNCFFGRIYSDIKKAYYKTELRDGMLHYTLYFLKKVGGKKIDIDIFRESTGNKSMLRLFPILYECARGRTVFYDELDLGIHDLLMKDVMDEIKETFKGQFVATTHNTSLLETTDPKSAFMIQVDSQAYKRILPISRIGRTQKNHNNRDRYMKGMFDAVPIIGMVCLDDIVRYTEKMLEEVT